MAAPNGHAHTSALDSGEVAPPVSANPNMGTARQYSAEEIQRLVSALEVPFDVAAIDWRVTNTSKQATRPRGQVVPYADQRAYTDRLNLLFTPAGWTRKYALHTSANFQRGKDQRTVAKIFVTCELTIFGIGSHSATGEEFADGENAGTAAEAQAFKRAACCFGLGRYLYYYVGDWVDLDERNRPRATPRLPEWATPAGWLQGLRPNGLNQPNSARTDSRPSGSDSQAAAVIEEIEAFAEPLGRGLYRGLLRDQARVWNPHEIQDLATRQRVLEHMRAAERGLRRLEAALDETDPEALMSVLRSLGIRSFERVDNLETLKRIVLDLEAVAARKK